MFRNCNGLWKIVSASLECHANSCRALSTTGQLCFSPTDAALGRGDRKTKRGKRFAASTGFHRPKQETIRRARARFMDPTGLRRLTLPYISCIETGLPIEESSDSSQSLGMSEQAPDVDSTGSAGNTGLQ